MGRLSRRLTDRGPHAPAIVMASRQRVEALKAAGLPPPIPANITALIDTGASCSAIDSQLVARLNLQYNGLVHVHTPSTGEDHQALEQYDAALVFVDPDSGEHFYITLAVISTELHHQGFDALIGWDVLSRCDLHVYGPDGTFELNWA